MTKVRSVRETAASSDVTASNSCKCSDLYAVFVAPADRGLRRLSTGKIRELSDVDAGPAQPRQWPGLDDRAQRFHERLIVARDIRRARSEQNLAAGELHVPSQIGRECGLPDARFPAQQNQPRLAGRASLPLRDHSLAVDLAADESNGIEPDGGQLASHHRHRGGHDRSVFRPHPGHGPHLHLSEPFEIERSRSTQSSAVLLDEVRSDRGPDAYLPCLGGGTQPGRLDHRGAEVVVVATHRCARARYLRARTSGVRLVARRERSPARCIRTAAETASRSRSNTAMIPSPTFFTTSPRWSVTHATSRSRWASMAAPNVSSPTSLSNAVEFTRSVKSMATFDVTRADPPSVATGPSLGLVLASRSGQLPR